MLNLYLLFIILSILRFWWWCFEFNVPLTTWSWRWHLCLLSHPRVTGVILHSCRLSDETINQGQVLSFKNFCMWSFFANLLFSINWATSSEFGTYCLCEQRGFRRACASAQSRQNLRCLLIQAVSQEEPSTRKPDPLSLWMAGHAQLKFVMTECSKTQIRLTRLNYCYKNSAGTSIHFSSFWSILKLIQTSPLRTTIKS